MGLGIAKGFIIFLAIAIGLGWWTRNILNGVIVLLSYAVIKIVWKGITDK